ncbi:ComEC/Rec2 family competence protein [Marinoscillum sp.]|uniref:ComEC/Rec2 family competence protein n=1 Tax=Marinoscillum sp. TaxID=2024838 RepID=UPI003BADB1B0
MFKWSAFPFIRLSIALSVGIVLSESSSVANFLLDFWWILPIIALLMYAVGRTIQMKGLVWLFLMAVIGGCLGYLQVESRFDQHYTHFEQPDRYVGVVKSYPNERKRHFRYEVDVFQLEYAEKSHSTYGTVHLYIEKSAGAQLTYGDVVMVDKGYFDVSAPKNPEEFNYQAYLAHQNIYAHAFVDASEVTVLDHMDLNPLLAWAFEIRADAQAMIHDYVPGEQEQAIVSALLLGIKDHLDNEIREAYSSAGAMHVLAVSGLHVGIIFMILNILCKPWKEHHYGRFLFMVLALSLIWMYALVTGFSPSVMRAATMFSVVIISTAFNKRANVYNSLGIAAFVLILMDPFVIYSVGFQLSFVAVFGILMFHPLIYHKLHVHSKVGDYLWSIICVSLAAQIATFPLTLYYFHQFPTYFLVSNLLVIPAAFVMLSAGLVLLLFGAVMPMVASVFGVLFGHFVWLVNQCVMLLQYLPFPLFDWLYVDRIDVISIYLIILLIYTGVTTYSYHSLRFAGYCFLLLNGWVMWKSWSTDQLNQVVFYEINGINAIDIIHEGNATLLLDSLPDSRREEVFYQVNPYRLAQGLPKAEDSWGLLTQSGLVRGSEGYTYFMIEGLQILMIQNLDDLEMVNPVDANVVLINDEINALPDQLSYDLLVFGNRLHSYQTREIRKQCEDNRYSYHSLKDDGYLVLDLNELVFRNNKNQLSHLDNL